MELGRRAASAGEVGGQAPRCLEIMGTTTNRRCLGINVSSFLGQQMSNTRDLAYFDAEDGQGRIFLDLPAAPVKVLLDALRMQSTKGRDGPLRLRQRGEPGIMKLCEMMLMVTDGADDQNSCDYDVR